MDQQYSPEYVKQLLAKQTTEAWNVYWSSVRLGWTVTGAGPYTYALAAGTEYRAFGYGIGDDLTVSSVGYPSGYGVATAAETNLLKRSSTVSGDLVEIHGMSIYLTADSDPYLALKTIENTSVVIAMNGEQQSYKLGVPGFAPGGGGLFGVGQSQILPPSQLEAFASNIGALANGMPTIDNFLPFPAPVYWKPEGSPDSSLIIKMRVERALSETATARAAVAAGAGTSGASAFAPPTATGAYGTWVGFRVRLHSRQIAYRSTNF
jgi:hypothetical protein